MHLPKGPYLNTPIPQLWGREAGGEHLEFARMHSPLRLAACQPGVGTHRVRLTASRKHLVVSQLSLG